MTQRDAYDLFFPLIENSGKTYFKVSLVYAELAIGGEFIETWTSDGLETTNYANSGDFIVQNLQTENLERYVVPPDMFMSRYKFFYWHDNGAICIPLGKVRAIQYIGEDTQFIAKWGRLMILKTGDFIVSPAPDFQEVYRIARKEFFETYEEDL
jgi:hypothetical protein